MPAALFARSRWDTATDYLYHWMGLGINVAESLGYAVIDLAGDEATPENLEDALRRFQFDVLFLGGHGNAGIFTLQNGEVALEACINDQLLSGNVTVMISCYTGQRLGPSIIEKRGVAYLGWLSDFRFVIDTNYPIPDDPVAAPFRDVVLEVMSRTLRGEPLQQVWDGTIARCDQLIDALWDRPEYIWSQVIECLKHDRDGLIAMGETEKYVVPPITLTLSLLPALGSIGAGIVGMLATVI